MFGSWVQNSLPKTGDQNFQMLYLNERKRILCKEFGNICSYLQSLLVLNLEYFKIFHLRRSGVFIVNLIFNILFYCFYC